MIRVASCTVLGLVTLAISPTLGQDNERLRGVWNVERYDLADGTAPPVTGHIFFGDQRWTVLFFVLGPEGSPIRGSGEGGTYRLRGDDLVFTHQYHLSAGEPIGPLAPAPLRMRALTDGTAAEERCTIELRGQELTISFPSGNAMSFRRRGEEEG